MRKRIIATTAVATLIGLTASSVQAQDFPSKGPIKLIVGFAPGGGTDAIARALNGKLAEIPGYFLLTTRDGRRIATSATSVLNEIDGADYAVSKGAGGGLVSITIPSSISEFDVEIRRGSSVVPAGDVVVNIRRPSMPSIQVSGNLAHTIVGEKKLAKSLLAVRTNGTSVNAPLDNGARISIAAGTALTRTELAGGHTMLIKRISGESIEVAIKGKSGSVINSTALDATNATTVSEITLSLSNDGEIMTTRAEVAAVPVRNQITANFTPRNTQSATNATVPSSIVIALPD